MYEAKDSVLLFLRLVPPVFAFPDFLDGVFGMIKIDLEGDERGERVGGGGRGGEGEAERKRRKRRREKKSVLARCAV